MSLEIETMFLAPLLKLAVCLQAYGQTFIHDDRFLSIIASCTAVFNSLGRPIWGAVADRFCFQVSPCVVNVAQFGSVRQIICSPVTEYD